MSTERERVRGTERETNKAAGSHSTRDTARRWSVAVVGVKTPGRAQCWCAGVSKLGVYVAFSRSEEGCFWSTSGSETWWDVLFCFLHVFFLFFLLCFGRESNSMDAKSRARSRCVTCLSVRGVAAVVKCWRRQHFPSEIMCVFRCRSFTSTRMCVANLSMGKFSNTAPSASLWD